MIFSRFSAIFLLSTITAYGNSYGSLSKIILHAGCMLGSIASALQNYEAGAQVVVFWLKSY